LLRRGAAARRKGRLCTTIAPDNEGPRVAKSNLAIRLITAGVVAPVLLLTMFLGPAWAWYGIVFAATLLGAWELFGMTHPNDSVARAVGTVQAGGVSLAVYYGTHDARVLFSAVAVSVILGALVPLWRLGDIKTAALRVMAGMGGPLYVGGLLATLALLRRDNGDDGPAYVLMTLMFGWLGDTGGYFVGRYFGKTKLYEAVSPKKTREGFVGSLLGACFGAGLAHFWYLPAIPLAHALGLALFSGALGQLGDLVESLVKRSTGVKDSGALVPGHGGILDRVDALLIVSPIVHMYTQWLGGRT
jgi:phosphatidate cytidylyltransferase